MEDDGILDYIRFENAIKMEMVGNGVIEVREFQGRTSEKVGKESDEEGI